MVKKKDSEPVEKKEPTPLWSVYRVRWEFLTRLCGSVPANAEMIEDWLKARRSKRKTRPAGSKSIAEINEEVLESLEQQEEESFSGLVFQRHNGGLVMRYSTVKAHFKDCGRVVSQLYVGKIVGEKSFAVRVINGLNLDPRQYWLPIRRPDGTPVTQADGKYEKPVHVRGPRGEPLNALKCFEYVDPPSVLEFTLKVLGNSVKESDLRILMEYGGVHGYAGERSDGEGRYAFQIERITLGEEAAKASDG
jgi:hypothetical protein